MKLQRVDHFAKEEDLQGLLKFGVAMKQTGDVVSGAADSDVSGGGGGGIGGGGGAGGGGNISGACPAPRTSLPIPLERAVDSFPRGGQGGVDHATRYLGGQPICQAPHFMCRSFWSNSVTI